VKSSFYTPLFVQNLDEQAFDLQDFFSGKIIVCLRLIG